MKKLLIIFIFIPLLGGVRGGFSFAQQNKIDSLITALQTATEDTNKIIILYELCREYRTSDPDKAMKYGKRGLILSEQLGIRNLVASGLNNIGTVYRLRYEYHKAIQYHLKALIIHKRSRSQLAVGWTLVEIGNDYYWQNNYTNGIEYYQKALAIFEKSDLKHGIAVCLNNLGMIYETQGDYVKAIEYYLYASNKYEELGNKEGIAWSFELIANIYLHQDDDSNALKYYLKSLNIYEELNKKTWIAISYNNIGLVHNNQGNYSRALEYFFNALNIFEQLGIDLKIATTTSYIGNVYAKKDELQQALNYQKKALGIQEKIADKNGIVHSLYGIGNTCNKSGKSSEAIKYLQRSITIAKELGMKTALKDAYKCLSTAYVQVNDYQKAHNYYQKYAGLKDDLYDEKTSERIAKIQAKYEAGKKEREIELLSKENELQSLELIKNRIMVYTSSGGFGLVLILALVSVRAYRQKRKINEQLENKVEERTSELSRSNEALQAEINERKEAEEAIRKSEHKHRMLIETMKEGVIQVNKSDIMQFVNEQFCKMVGYSRKELLGKNAANLFLKGPDKVFMGEFKSVREKGSSAQNIIQLRKKDGEFIRAIISGSTNYDEHKNTTGSTAVVTDITKIMEYEENLDKINRELNTFIYKASHDLKGPLSSSIGIVNMCKENIDDMNIVSNLDLISSSLDKLDRILQDLMQITLIRQGQLKILPIKVKPLLDNIVQTFSHYPDFEKTNVIIEHKLRRPLASDAEILGIILRNLFENALKYRKIGAENSFIKITTASKNKKVVITIADNGIGIAEKYHKRIYNMFVRASTISEGSGLGLYSVKNAVEKLKGTIKLKSKENQGTTFTLHLPDLDK